jgi:hypothetical protein
MLVRIFKWKYLHESQNSVVTTNNRQACQQPRSRQATGYKTHTANDLFQTIGLASVGDSNIRKSLHKDLRAQEGFRQPKRRARYSKANRLALPGKVLQTSVVRAVE